MKVHPDGRPPQIKRLQQVQPPTSPKDPMAAKYDDDDDDDVSLMMMTVCRVSVCPCCNSILIVLSETESNKKSETSLVHSLNRLPWQHFVEVPLTSGTCE